MTELIEEQEATQPDIERYLDMVRRRHVPFLLLLFVGWAAVWSFSWVLPSKYKSTTQILVEQPTMPASYVASNVNGDLQDRLASISQQILSRTRLLMIIDKVHLYDDSGSSDDETRKVASFLTMSVSSSRSARL